tara:strand:- start:138 stop:653 length:516 start_codon:yes stop_codon:yes gene_type:complete
MKTEVRKFTLKELAEHMNVDVVEFDIITDVITLYNKEEDITTTGESEKVKSDRELLIETRNIVQNFYDKIKRSNYVFPTTQGSYGVYGYGYDGSHTAVIYDSNPKKKTLSDKGLQNRECLPRFHLPFYTEEDVKEAIKEMTDKITNIDSIGCMSHSKILDVIKEVVGERLI